MKHKKERIRGNKNNERKKGRGTDRLVIGLMDIKY
jgi:hypothetical protein